MPVMPKLQRNCMNVMMRTRGIFMKNLIWLHVESVSFAAPFLWMSGRKIWRAIRQRKARSENA